MRLRQYIVCLLLLILPFGAWSQVSALHKVRAAARDTIQLDSLSLVPGSIRVTIGDSLLDTALYRVDIYSGTLFLTDSTITDTLTISYRTLPFVLRPAFRHKTTPEVTAGKPAPFQRYVIGAPNGGNLFEEDGLQKSGSISRGIAFGNAQNLSVNSSLNLQLSGRITDRFSLLASVSDDNIPVQPEGNTAQLQDFDQVFIQLYDENTRLIAGDFILRRPRGYFMNYFKRAQGAYVNSKFESGSGGLWEAEASGSVSKGRFARNVIQGIEGNQGPYRLRGADNELFIVVLAGTEAVYIDGVLLERGQDRDYIIDYNAAEIIFTPRQFITKDRRITVEFQYSDKRYARPMIQASVSRSKGGLTAYMNLFSENDARNQPLQQELTDEDRAVLSAAGDDPLEASVSGIDSVGFSNSQVLYALIDSLGYDSVLLYSTDPESALYRAVFSFVGQGNGDYAEDGFTANGRKFRWIAPVEENGQVTRQGSYAPIYTLVAPRKKQLAVAGLQWLRGEVRPGERTLTVRMEGGVSNDDRNTFSSRDAADDVGFAARVELEGALYRRDSTDVSGKKAVPSHRWGGHYEYTGLYFSRIERFREVEFERNWNLDPTANQEETHSAGFSYVFVPRGIGEIGIGADGLQLGQGYQGAKGKLHTLISTAHQWKAVTTASWLYTQGENASDFLRHKSDLSKQWGWFRLGFRDEHERNQRYVGDRDSLSAASYQFYDWEINAGTSDTSRTRFTVFYRDRIDRRPVARADLGGVARADQYGASFQRPGKHGGRFSTTISNRRLRVTDPERFTQLPENTLLGRVEYSFRSAQGVLQGSTFYEAGSGLEQRREFIFFEVPAGQGTHVWIDYDGDGVKDLSEFEVAQFAYEANYIRSFVQTNDYVRTYTNQFSQSIQLQPSRVWKNPTSRWQRLLVRFSDQAAYKIDRKTNREQGLDRLNPFLSDVADSNLFSLNGSLRNVLFFNKTDPKYGMEFTTQRSGNKSLLSNGFESRADQYQQLGLRWNFYRALTLFFDARLGEKEVRSDFLAGRNYQLNYRGMKPKLTWQQGTTSRFSLHGEYTEKNNTIGDREAVVIRRIGGECTLNSPGKGLVQCSVEWVDMTYTGASNTSLAFDMLEGLVPGQNIVWGATVQRTVAKNLQLNLQYNGRKPSELRTIHSGGVQVRAYF